jgi:hypothetical protein
MWVEVDITKHIDPAQQMSMELWLSYDDGDTWQFEGGAARYGDPASVDMNGKPVAFAGIGVEFSQSPDGQTFAPRQLPEVLAKVALSVTRNALESSVILSWE